MNIIADRFQIAAAAAVHDQSLVTSAEQMPEELVPAIEAAGVRAQKPFHAGHQIPQRRLNHEMKMVAHQAKGMNLPARLGASLAEGGQKKLPIWVLPENFLASIPAIHHMVHPMRYIARVEYLRRQRRMDWERERKETPIYLTG